MKNSIFMIALLWLMACESRQPGSIANSSDSIHLAAHAFHRPAASEVLARLKAGNEHFVNSFTPTHLHPDTPYNYYEQIMETGKEQHPVACVLTCMDSRVPPEIIFNQGIGNLFVLRVAGNVEDSDILGSMEYAVAEKGVQLIVVMGHTNCGAINAAFGHVDSATKDLSSLIAHVKKDVLPNDKPPYDASAKHNVNRTMEDILLHSNTIKTKFDDHELMLVGALYDVSNGHVTWKGSDW